VVCALTHCPPLIAALSSLGVFQGDGRSRLAAHFLPRHLSLPRGVHGAFSGSWDDRGIGLSTRSPWARFTTMGNANSNIDSLKEELGWLKVLFAVSAAVDASLMSWISQNYSRAERLVFVLASLSAIVVSGVLVWMNYAAYRNIRQLKNLP
jgi:hypothetical protein